MSYNPSTNSFSRSFNFTRNLVIAVFILVGILMIGTVGYRFSRMTSGKPMYEITVPTYGNTSPNTYFATQYVEKDGCIIFKDEFGFEQKVCGAYQIQKW